MTSTRSAQPWLDGPPPSVIAPESVGLTESSGPGESADAGPLERTLASAMDWLLDDQHEDGHWLGQLESNVCMEAEWVMAMHVLGAGRDGKYNGVVRAIIDGQRPDGSWRVYHDAPAGDINCTVEAYTALRIAGLDPSGDVLSRARAWIQAYPGNRGDGSGRRGLASVRNFTKYWLALLGEWPWRHTPQLPPEIIYLPPWTPFCIYRFASWARATMLPLAVLSSRRFTRPLDDGRRMDELFCVGPSGEPLPGGRAAFDYSLPRRGSARGLRALATWEGFFVAADELLHRYVGAPWHPGRESAIQRCLAWIIQHQEADGAWSGIQPPWVYSLMALRCEGYALDHPVLRAGIEAFDKHWRIERDACGRRVNGRSAVGDASPVPGNGSPEDGAGCESGFDQGPRVYLQASESPVWDTELAALALLDCGHEITTSEPLRRAVRWLLNQQVWVEGDWKVYVPQARPGGWAFEYENDLYPDVDDTAVALIVLARVRRQITEASSSMAVSGPNGTRATTAALARLNDGIETAVNAGVAWMLAMQSKSGGWAAFDKDNDTQLLTRIPFCDFGELLDPPSADVTGHVIEALAELGYPRSHPAMRRGLDYLYREQEEDGSWFGRWGVNHIYGTAAVLPALAAAGEDMGDPRMRAAADWVRDHQQPDGGWGESCASYMDPDQRGRGPATASQTAWALIALLAMGSEDYDDSIRAGVDFLARAQLDADHRPDRHSRPSGGRVAGGEPDGSAYAGTWHEPQYTGTGFPGYGVGERIDALARADALDQDLALQRAFMINYNLYRHYFPLMALGRARRHFSRAGLDERRH